MIFVDEASREGKAASLKATECYVLESLPNLKTGELTNPVLGSVR